MRRVVSLVFVACLAALPALAQPPFGKGGFGRGGMMMSPTMLVNQKAVQDELKLTEDQVKKLSEVTKKQFGGFADFKKGDKADIADFMKKLQERQKASEKLLAEVLKPEQMKRLRQIALQVSGAGAFNDEQVLKELNLTEDQKAKFKEIQTETSKLLAKLPDEVESRTELQKKQEELNKAVPGKMMNVLTEAQKAKWKELTGEPFKGEIRMPFGPGGFGKPPE